MMMISVAMVSTLAMDGGGAGGQAANSSGGGSQERGVLSMAVNGAAQLKNQLSADCRPFQTRVMFHDLH